MPDENQHLPIPDPTKLTTDAVNAAKSDIEKLFDTKLNALRSELRDFGSLVEEKFKGRDTALAAALKAQQEQQKLQNDSNAIAAEKAEKSTTKQIDSAILRIDDLKERISTLDRKDWASVGGFIFGAIGVVAMVVAALMYHH
jgi:chromosome segregation ATPase